VGRKLKSCAVVLLIRLNAQPVGERPVGLCQLSEPAKVLRAVEPPPQIAAGEAKPAAAVADSILFLIAARGRL